MKAKLLERGKGKRERGFEEKYEKPEEAVEVRQRIFLRRGDRRGSSGPDCGEQEARISRYGQPMPTKRGSSYGA